MNKIIFIAFTLFVVFGSLSSCNVYRQRILFRTDTEVIPENFSNALADAESNYVIQRNDYLEIEVYTNKGEIIIDPNNEIIRSYGSGNQNAQNNTNKLNPKYLVQANGSTKLPVIGEVQIAGLTLNQADSLLAKRLETYYNDVYVITRYVNKRVVVLGEPGGQVIPLQDENVSLIEVIALAGGVSTQAKVHKIRLIRGDLKNPEVRIINLSTIQGMRQASLKVQPNDIIYIEPLQRIPSEIIRDVTPVFSLVTSVITLFVLLRTL